MKMKLRTKIELQGALERTKEDLRKCQKGALPAYVHRLCGIAVALLYALGYDERENYLEKEKILSKCPYFVHRRKKHGMKFRTKRSDFALARG